MEGEGTMSRGFVLGFLCLALASPTPHSLQWKAFCVHLVFLIEQSIVNKLTIHIRLKLFSNVSVHGLCSPWNSPEHWSGCLSLLQGIFPTQG